tara:strand:- start:1300 stop:1557 length:258 start_codon:yes stop_codon:yes gene_type:complete
MSNKVKSVFTESNICLFAGGALLALSVFMFVQPHWFGLAEEPGQTTSLSVKEVEIAESLRRSLEGQPSEREKAAVRFFLKRYESQ